MHDFGLPPRRVRALPMDLAVTIEGVHVTLIDANHVRFPHLLAALELASSWPASATYASRPLCPGLFTRSACRLALHFYGACKVLSRVLKRYLTREAQRCSARERSCFSLTSATAA